MKRKIAFFLLPVFIIGSLIGCHRDLPKPETKVKAANANQIKSDVLPVYNQGSKQIPSIYVQHKTKGNNVFIECILTGISFRAPEHAGEKTGKLIVWVDGKRTNEVSSAVFIMKNLSPGNHKIKLEVVNLNNEPYGLSKEFLVNIPK